MMMIVMTMIIKLSMMSMMTIMSLMTMMTFYPIGHLVCISQSMMIVENHDGGDHARSHHEHDAIEIGA